MNEIVSREINTKKARAFRQIVTAGWGNLSDGNVEAPTGHFTLVHIEPNELPELMEACFDSDYPGTITTYPGSYLVNEDSDGNTELIEYLSLDAALRSYNRQQREFALWAPVCPECGNEGPHTRLPGNRHICACGKSWDPTEGVETKREDMALENVQTRHSFDFRDGADVTKNLCGVEGGLQRDPSNTNCPECLEIIEELRDTDDEPLVPGWRPKAISELEDESEKLYLKCENCGEVFDELKTADQHDGEFDGEPCYDSHHRPSYALIPESEAL